MLVKMNLLLDRLEPVRTLELCGRENEASYDGCRERACIVIKKIGSERAKSNASAYQWKFN